MAAFRINKDSDKISSINRTVRFKPDVFERLMRLSDQNAISFNKLVNQCVEYALEHLDETEE